MKRAILMAAACGMALAACQKQTAANGEAKPAAISAEPTQPAAVAPGRPAPKAGLWSQSMSMAGMNQTIKVCMDAATSQKTVFARDGRSNCAEERVTPRVGGGWDFHSVCKLPNGETVTSDGSATGDFGSHYKVEVNSVTSGSPMPQANGTHKTSIEATWQGPCPAGMNPGDMQMPGGIKITKGGGVVGAPSAGSSYGPDHMPSQADIAKMRAQAMEMAKGMKDQAK